MANTLQCEDLKSGVDLFNRDLPFEAHEAWEAVWLQLEKNHPARKPLQGLIQVAAGLVKLQRNNRRGTQLLLRRGAAKLHDTRALPQAWDWEKLAIAAETVAAVAETNQAQWQEKCRAYGPLRILPRNASP